MRTWQECCCGWRSSVMWHCVTVIVFTYVSMDCTAFRVQTVRSSATSGNLTQDPLSPQDLDLQIFILVCGLTPHALHYCHMWQLTVQQTELGQCGVFRQLNTVTEHRAALAVEFTNIATQVVSSGSERISWIMNQLTTALCFSVACIFALFYKYVYYMKKSHNEGKVTYVNRKDPWVVSCLKICL